MADDLFTIDIVRDFIVAKGGKITNHELVNHFRTFLNDPHKRVANREKFKEYLNTLARLKLDQSGEKVLVLKKEFKNAPGTDKVCSSSDMSTLLQKPVGTSHIPKRKEKLPPNLVAIDSELANSFVSMETVTETEKPPIEESIEINVGDVNVEDINFEGVNEPTICLIDQEQKLDIMSEEPVVKSEIMNKSADEMTAFEDDSTVHLEEKLLSDSNNMTISAVSVSVKERAQHINTSHSGPTLPGPAIKKKWNRAEKNGCENEDVSVETISNEPLKETYNAPSAIPAVRVPALLAIILADFTNGYTALHWAAKHGNTDVIKLICGKGGVSLVNHRSNGGYTPLHIAAMHNREAVVELLVTTYGANTFLRDYSGRKPNQYNSNAVATLHRKRPIASTTLFASHRLSSF